MALPAARVSMPAKAAAGAVIQVKALIRHPMETGYRVDNVGRKIPRHIVKRFSASFGDVELFRMDMTQGVAANPFIAFSLVATRSGEYAFTWEDDLGAVVTVRKPLEVTS